MKQQIVETHRRIKKTTTWLLLLLGEEDTRQAPCLSHLTSNHTLSLTNLLDLYIFIFMVISSVSWGCVKSCHLLLFFFNPHLPLLTLAATTNLPLFLTNGFVYLLLNTLVSYDTSLTTTLLNLPLDIYKVFRQIRFGWILCAPNSAHALYTEQIMEHNNKLGPTSRGGGYFISSPQAKLSLLETV